MKIHKCICNIYILTFTFSPEYASGYDARKKMGGNLGYRRWNRQTTVFQLASDSPKYYTLNQIRDWKLNNADNEVPLTFFRSSNYVNKCSGRKNPRSIEVPKHVTVPVSQTIQLGTVLEEPPTSKIITSPKYGQGCCLRVIDSTEKSKISSCGD